MIILGVGLIHNWIYYSFFYKGNKKGLQSVDYPKRWRGLCVDAHLLKLLIRLAVGSTDLLLSISVTKDLTLGPWGKIQGWKSQSALMEDAKVSAKILTENQNDYLLTVIVCFLK